MSHTKNSWTQLLVSLDDVKPTLENRHIIAKVADKFTKQIAADRDLFDLGDAFSDCALMCPVWGTKYDKSHGLCSFIAPPLFPEKLTDDMTDNERELAVTDDFSKLIRKLRKEYRARYEEEKKRELAFKRVVGANSRNEYDELAKFPLSKHILVPEATVIDLSPDNEFDQIIEYITDNTTFPTSSSRSPSYIEFPKGTVHRDGRLDLCMQGVSVTTLKRILNALSNNTHIKHLLLGNNAFGDEGAELIANFMKSKESRIVTWYICACSITSVGIEKICDALTNTFVESLWLKRNPLKVEGAKCIAKMLEHNTTIRHLDIFNTGILDDGCEHIFKALKYNTTLDTLYIGANGVTIDGVRHIADYFNYIVGTDSKESDDTRTVFNTSRLHTLFLDVNRIGDQGLHILCEALKKYKKLIRLSVGANRITHVGMKDVADTFINDPSLVFLDVGMCRATINVHELPNNIGDAGVEHIQRLIEQNKTLRILNIRHNAISDAGVDKIISSLKTNTSLFKVHVEQSGGKSVSTNIKDCSIITDHNIKMSEHNAHDSINTPNLNNHNSSVDSTDSPDSVDSRDIVKFLSHGPSISNTESRYLLGI